MRMIHTTHSSAHTQNEPFWPDVCTVVNGFSILSVLTFNYRICAVVVLFYSISIFEMKEDEKEKKKKHQNTAHKSSNNICDSWCKICHTLSMCIWILCFAFNYCLKTFILFLFLLSFIFLNVSLFVFSLLTLSLDIMLVVGSICASLCLCIYINRNNNNTITLC